MDVKDYIESGILELYVAGALSKEETKNVYEEILKNPDVLSEILKIEAAIVSLTAAAAPTDTKHFYKAVKEHLGLDDQGKVIPITKTKTSWWTYTGWAAAIVFAAGFFWLMNQNKQLENQIDIVNTDKQTLELQIEKANTSLAENEKLISILRDRNIISVPLEGQAAFPDAYAKVYWDTTANNIYLDVQGLPTPPEGMVYQVWSLTLDPLTPTSLGTLDDFNTDENKIFTIANANASEAFGITLEPAGGSESPTLEQLYTLGAVTASS